MEVAVVELTLGEVAVAPVLVLLVLLLVTAVPAHAGQRGRGGGCSWVYGRSASWGAGWTATATMFVCCLLS